MLPWNPNPGPPTNRLYRTERFVRHVIEKLSHFSDNELHRICLALIIALPLATPVEFKNNAKFALWDFTNCGYNILQYIQELKHNLSSKRVAEWICLHTELSRPSMDYLYCYPQSIIRPTHFILGSFDSSVHISEEAANASTAVPWAIVGAISIGGILGWGESLLFASKMYSNPCTSPQYVPCVLYGNRSTSPR